MVIVDVDAAGAVCTSVAIAEKDDGDGGRREEVVVSMPKGCYIPS